MASKKAKTEIPVRLRKEFMVDDSGVPIWCAVDNCGTKAIATAIYANRQEPICDRHRIEILVEMANRELHPDEK